MRIHAIALKDFTSYEAVTVGFDATINIIVGENAAGKTSIVDAVTYCLTGHCDRTDKAGRGAEAMIRTGARDAGVGLRIGPDALVVSRSIPGGLSLDGHEGGQRELQELLYETIGAGDGAVTAALNTHAFLDLPPSEQKSLLFGLMGLRFNRANVIDQIIADTPQTQAEAAERMLNAAPPKLFDGSGQTWGNLHKHFYELRRNFKRDLKALGEQPQLAVVPDVGDKDHLAGEIEGLAELLYEVCSRTDRAAEVEEEGGRLEAKIANLRAQLETAADTKAARAQLGTVREELAALDRDASTARARADELAKAVAAIDKAGTDRACPLAPGVVTCPLTKPKRQDLLAKLSDEMQEAERQAAQATDAAELLRPRCNELKIMADAPDRPTLEGMISERQRRLGELPEPVDPAASRAEIADLEGRIAERKAALEEIVRAEGARAAVEQQAAQREKLAAEVEALEVLVELTGPKGIPGRLLGETIGPLQDLANKRLLQLTGGRYQLNFEVEPDFRITVTHDGAEGDLKRLSSSERMRIGIILQDSISRLSGLRVMVVDNADVLDPHNRMLLTETLLAVKDDYDTIIVLSTGDPATVSDPGIEGVAVYRITDGQVERVTEEAMVP